MTARRTRLALFLGFSLTLLVLSALPVSADIPCEWSGVERIVAVGDLHGDYENFVKILKGTRVVDSDLHWTAGPVHLVQIGDVLDRGPEARQIFDLLLRLEKEAEEAGGKVHVLLGNHEEMNLTGTVFNSNPDYVTLDQFISFLPKDFRKEQEKNLTKRLQRGSSRGRGSNPREIINSFWASLRNSTSARRKYVINLNDEYGDWLRRLNVVIKINGVVFVHGGISEKYSRWGLPEINDRYRLEIADYWRAFRRMEQPRVVQPSILYREDSPLWYRELATVPEEDLAEELDRILDNLGAKTMVIAHTPQLVRSAEEMQRFGGKVWIADTGISEAYRDYGGKTLALIIQEGYFNVWGLNDENADESDVPPPSLFSYGIGLLRAVSGAR